MIERFGELCVLCGVFFGETGNFGGSSGVVIIEEKRLAIGRGSEDARIGAENFAIEFVEVEIPGNVRSKRAYGVRKCGSVEAGMEFFRDSAAANHLAAFENKRLEAAFGEIERGDE